MLNLGEIFIILGFIIILLESIFPGLYFPALGIALVIYGIFLIIFPNLAFFTAIIAGVLTIIILNRLVYSSKDKYLVGAERLIGKVGKAIDDFKEGYGKIKIGNEIWHATSEDKEIKKGDKVKVIGFEGVHLIVKKVD